MESRNAKKLAGCALVFPAVYSAVEPWKLDGLVMRASRAVATIYERQGHPATESLRAELATVVLAATSIATFAISWRFWTPYRTYPLVPYIPGLHPTELSVGVLVAACVGIALACAPRLRIIGLSSFLLSTIFLILEDQSRLQPYIYVELIVAMGLLYQAAFAGDLNALRAAMVFVYLWAGIQKLNVHYFREVFPWVFFTPWFSNWLGFLQTYRHVVPALALLSALMEVSAAVLLFWPRTRPLGVATVAAIHTIALLLIGPIGMRYAPVVWPWNFAMIAYVLILFTSYDQSILKIRDPVHCLIVILFGLLPILNLFSLWDAYLSFHAFSGAHVDAYLQIQADKAYELPSAARAVLAGNRVPFDSWSMMDTRASAYPAERVYRRIFAQVCKEAPDTHLVIVSKPEWPSGRTTNSIAACDPGPAP